MATLEEIEERRAARKAAAKVARDEQYAKDLEALDALEVEHGDGKVSVCELPAHTPGLPTMVVVRCPDPKVHKRFTDMVHKAQKHGDYGPASNLLADACVAYPDAATYTKVREVCPGIHASVAERAVKLSQAKAVDEGKG